MGKIVSSRSPVDYPLWQEAGLLKHGEMQRPKYAFGVFRRHWNQACPVAAPVVLKLGPGDTVLVPGLA